MQLVLLVLSAILVNNFVLSRFLGICPFLGVSKKLSTALGMTAAVMFVMTLASTVCWLVFHGLLRPYGLEYLQTISFILIIAAMVQLVELALQKLSPGLYRSLGIYLPLITTNCAVLGCAVMNIMNESSLLVTAVFSLAAAMGFGLALVLFSGIREVLALADTPRSFRGTAIALLTAGTLSLSFMGFAGLVK
ncbi:MAG: electron transport complex subunit RsxA [Gemmatimonas sp.]|nr:electron transport complex subunit RsxA [Gemmatimonas sp.]MBK6897769.1 electron transport complex subunit RsxA [bacterium]MBK9302916.1 electron transport complex subunit RsxA [bacterium]NTV03904.1 electron transport complex subunit RsxA [bacterium]